MAATLRNVIVTAVANDGSQKSHALNSNMHTFTLKAITAAVNLRLVSGETTHIWTVAVGIPESFALPSFAGATIYFIGASGSLQIMEFLNTNA